MMFLQFAVYGLWLPLAARFLSAPTIEGGLGFSDAQIGYIIAVAGAVGAIASPFIAGQIADRFFSTERFLGSLLIISGILKFVTAYQTSFEAWVILSILYALFYMPTLALCNSLAMTNLQDPKLEFPGVRVWGTIAWIVVSWAFPMIWLQTDLQFQWLPPFFKGDVVPMAPGRMIDSFKISGVLSIAYGVFCWTLLPHSPPRKDATEKWAFAKAFGLVRHRSFAVLLAVALPISIVHFFYFMQTSKFLAFRGLSDAYIMPVMSIGQFAEIAVIALLGKALTRFGFRTVITFGALAYALRYYVFSTTDAPLSLIIAAQALHGFCFAGFFAASFIYIDRLAPKDVRHSVQTVFMLVMFGLGPLIAGQLNGHLSERFTNATGTLDYIQFWNTAALVALASAVLFALFFRDESQTIRHD
ncbi:MFS transporter [Verrucomicrobia bacterium]|nr:MFS transporter [Verrucomicrobiota bacterium]